MDCQIPLPKEENFDWEIKPDLAVDPHPGIETEAGAGEASAACEIQPTLPAAALNSNAAAADVLNPSLHEHPDLDKIPHRVDFNEYFYGTLTIEVGRRAIHAVNWTADNVFV